METIKEYQVQKMIFNWAKLQSCLYPELKMLVASMNGLRLTNKLAGKRAKEQGLKAGYPDIALNVPKGKYHALFIELKVGKNKLTPEQKDWQDMLNSYGNLAITCYGYEETEKAILDYLQLK